MEKDKRGNNLLFTGWIKALGKTTGPTRSAVGSVCSPSHGRSSCKRCGIFQVLGRNYKVPSTWLPSSMKGHVVGHFKQHKSPNHWRINFWFNKMKIKFSVSRHLSFIYLSLCHCGTTGFTLWDVYSTMSTTLTELVKAKLKNNKWPRSRHDKSSNSKHTQTRVNPESLFIWPGLDFQTQIGNISQFFTD